MIKYMIINVGTKNPTKIEAVREVAINYPLFKNSHVEGVEIVGGVSDQPLSLEETIAGARHRAQKAYIDCDYSFGIESGLFSVPHTKTNYMDTTVCAIYDGTHFHLGMSPSFEYPIKVTELAVNEGIEISEAYKLAGLTDHPKIGTAQGVIGELTKGRITRKDYTKQAIMMALIHLENPELYT